jgi:hypothetical protein
LETLSDKHKTEEIIGKLLEAEIVLALGSSPAGTCRRIEVSEQTFGSSHAPGMAALPQHRWPKEYGGLKTDQARQQSASHACLWPSMITTDSLSPAPTLSSKPTGSFADSFAVYVLFLIRSRRRMRARMNSSRLTRRSMIRQNPRARPPYTRACGECLGQCDRRSVPSVVAVQPLHIAVWTRTKRTFSWAHWRQLRYRHAPLRHRHGIDPEL